jgi:hypothetical protein
LVQEEQPAPPLEPVNFPPLLEPKTENRRSTLRLRHAGQVTARAEAVTRRSNSAAHFAQRNS